MVKQINFDLDGTLVDLYGVDGWLDDIKSANPRPYKIAKPMVNMSSLARQLHKLQKKGYEVNIITWLAKSGTMEYNRSVAATKKAWLGKHLPSVEFDNIHILPYGTPKELYGKGVLFDDEKPNRDNWCGNAYDVDNIIEVLKGME